MIAYKDNLCATQVIIPDIQAETVWAKVETDDGDSAYVGAYYRSPSDRSTSTIDDLDTAIGSLDTDKPIILGGDFNAGDINWDNNTVKPGSDRIQLCERLIETLNEHHIEQLQREPTRESALLDLFCTNRPSLVTSMDTIPGISDHNIVVVDTAIKARARRTMLRSICTLTTTTTGKPAK